MNISVDTTLTSFVLLWAVIDPIGTIPVFISATKDHQLADRKKIALIASTGAPLNSPNTTLHACAVNTVALITTGHANTAPASPMSVAPTPYV